MITQHATARASFKTWASTGENRKKFDADAVELCMAHHLRDDYNGAYNSPPWKRNVVKSWKRGEIIAYPRQATCCDKIIGFS